MSYTDLDQLLIIAERCYFGWQQRRCIARWLKSHNKRGTYASVKPELQYWFGFEEKPDY